MKYTIRIQLKKEYPLTTIVRVNNPDTIDILMKNKGFRLAKESSRYTYFEIHGDVGKAEDMIKTAIIRESLKQIASK